MNITVKRAEAILLFSAISGLGKYSTQAGFYLAANQTILGKVAKEHDSFVKTLQENYATRDKDGKIVMEPGTKNPKIEGEKFDSFEADYEKYLTETISVEGLRTFTSNDLRVRVSENGKSELVQPDLPSSYLAPLLEHGLLSIVD